MTENEKTINIHGFDLNIDGTTHSINLNTIDTDAVNGNGSTLHSTIILLQ